LWIEIDEENALAELRQGVTEIHRRGRLAYPALLVRDRNDFHKKK
jgi:hypothetical protein